ncbi:hypothetical protein FQN57_002525 [Myotisia sp. PD_48]|nr:hypothetical protein FQN57_002525 [Myotisia sp. PD_48]
MNSEPWLDGLDEDWISHNRDSGTSSQEYPNPQNNTYTHTQAHSPDPNTNPGNEFTGSILTPTRIPIYHQSTIHHQSRRSNANTEMPQWKERIARGDAPFSESVDLFAPIGLERVFKPPTRSSTSSQPRPLTSESAEAQNLQDRRNTGSRRIPTEHDLDDDVFGEGNSNSNPDTFYATFKTNDTSWMEHMSEVVIGGEGMSFRCLRSSGSGPGDVEPLREHLSALSLEFDSKLRSASAIQKKKQIHLSNRNASRSSFQRVMSTTSDTGCLYGDNTEKNLPIDGEDMTSQSLPEGLSMGTQDYGSIGGFVTTRRGGYADNDSFRRRVLSPSSAPSDNWPSINITTTPAPPQPPTPPDPSSHSNLSPQQDKARLRPSGSPLKLFGDHDTYTSNKLLRRMSQFEETNTSSINQTANEDIEQDANENDKGNLSPMLRLKPSPVKQYNFEPPSQSEMDMSPSAVDADSAIIQQHNQRFLYPPSKIVDTKRGMNSPAKGSSNPKRRRTVHQIAKKDEVWPEPLLSSTGFLTDDLSQGYIVDASNMDQSNYEVSNTSLLTRPSAPTPTKPRVHPAVDDSSIHHANIEPRKGQFHASKGSKGSFLSNFPAGIDFPTDKTRKGSITTEDFLTEATRIMDIIRAKGGPISGLASLEESVVNLEDDENANTYTDDSSEEQFSRPPSRDGVDLRTQRTVRQQHPRVVSHLKKFEEKDDFDILMGASVGSLRLRQRAKSFPQRESGSHRSDGTESSPKNLRIRQGFLNLDIHQRTETIPFTQTSLQSQKSGRNLPSSSGSSSSSGAKGVISLDLVSHLIPENVGRMVYDRDNQTWVKLTQQRVNDALNRSQTTSEDDPFKDIPDLSVDELQELLATQTFTEVAHELPTEDPDENHEDETKPQIETVPLQNEASSDNSRPLTRDSAQTIPSDSSSLQSKYTRFTSSCPKPGTRATSWATEELEYPLDPQKQPVSGHYVQPELISTIPIPEEDDADHHASSPCTPHDARKQTRTVTITFSSPLVSRVEYQNDEPVPETNGEEADTQSAHVSKAQTPSQRKPQKSSILREKHHGLSMSLIKEQTEYSNTQIGKGLEQQQELSIIPQPTQNDCTRLAPPPCADTSYSFHLSPLSEFTMHQADESMRLEMSYIAERTDARSLRQVHGTLALAAEDLVKHITDSEPYEAYWEHIRRLDLHGKGLVSLHQLSKYCSRLEELDISDNRLGHLGGIPSTIRNLNSPYNCLSSLTSWSHMTNLQYLDISHNNCDNLDGLAGLIHLRGLKANDNNLTCIKGVFGLDGLLTLEIRNNSLTMADFKNSELFRLNHVDMRGNRLTAVKNVEMLRSLETLDIRNNSITRFTVSRALEHLESLKMSSNSLCDLDVSPFPSLRLLYVDANCLSTVANIDCCQFLDTLSMREQTSPSNASKLSSCHSGTPLTLDIDLSRLPSLRKLYLSSNHLSPSTLSPNLPISSLQLLDLASCAMNTLPENFGENFPCLKSLNLNFNALSDVSSLQGIRRLKSLFLVGNRITRLRRLCQVLRKIGGAHGSLTKVDVRGNPITVGFYPSLVTGTEKIKQINYLKSQHPKYIQQNGDDGEVDLSLPPIGGGKDITRYPSYDAKNYSGYPPLAPITDTEKAEKTQKEIDDPYTVPFADQDADAKYVVHLDETTQLRRRVVELMVHTATSGRLKYLDGLSQLNGPNSGNDNNDGRKKVRKDWVWTRLEALGVLKRKQAKNDKMTTITTQVEDLGA